MSNQYISPRYGPTYRTNEIALICQHARKGDSLTFVGVAGTGKSNMIKFLRDYRSYTQTYLNGAYHNTHFAVVDATTWQRTPLSLWQLMLDGLMQAADLDGFPLSDVHINNLQNEVEVLSMLKQQLTQMCKVHQHQVMFILDDFDEVLRQGPLSMLEQLSQFRNDGNRERLSYLLMTKGIPHILGRDHQLETQSKFYDLFQNHIYALPLYNREDASQMLKHLNTHVDRGFDTPTLMMIRDMAGGHARLIKIIFDTWQFEPPNIENVLLYFAQKPAIQQECRRLFQHMHQQEQEVLLRFIHKQDTEDDADTVAHLQQRGLLLPDGQVFSPLMELFLTRYIDLIIFFKN
ncbi:MAG: AAA family ATPase [Chloroflexota bacterium]